MTASAKARRLLANAAIHTNGTAAVYMVNGDHGIYRVVVGDGWATCTCPNKRGVCSHQEAAVILHEALVES